jgi:site-specific recombinase XerD
MKPAPVITIHVRHSPGCRYGGDEFHKGCQCRKHFRWSQDGKQHRRKAGTRSWTEAERLKRDLEDQLAGRAPVEPTEAQLLTTCIDIFLKDKEAQNVSKHVVGMYRRELSRLLSFSESQRILTVAEALTLENLTAYRNTWPTHYRTSYSRSLVQKRLNGFRLFCYDAGWITRIPRLSTIKVEMTETEPLTEKEYQDLLNAIPGVIATPKAQAKLRTLIELMRWSGLAVRDAATLKRSALSFDEEKALYRVISTRAKTGAHLYIPIPPALGKQLLEVLNGNSVYVFWNRGEGTEERQAWNMSEAISKVFDAAKIHSDGHMVSHRLRATFAVDLLQKGVPLEHVSKLLGHRSVTTTEKHYARWIKGRQDRLDTIVSDTWK